jgi:preprotein translocase subunit SecD
MTIRRKVITLLEDRMRALWHIAGRGPARVVLVIIALSGADPAAAQSISQQAGCLSFHEVHSQVTAQEALRTRVPTGYRIYHSVDKENAALLLREIPIVSGAELADAQVDFDVSTNEPIVTLQFDAAAAHKLGVFTESNIGRPFAIVLDGQVISHPVIREPILAGKAQVSGGFTIELARRLVALLRLGVCT